MKGWVESMEMCWNISAFCGGKASIVKALAYLFAVILTVGLLLDMVSLRCAGVSGNKENPGMIGMGHTGVDDVELPTGNVLDELPEIIAGTEKEGRTAPKDNEAGGGTGSMLTAELVSGTVETDAPSAAAPELPALNMAEPDTAPEDSMAPVASGGDLVNPSPIAAGVSGGNVVNPSPAAGVSESDAGTPDPTVPIVPDVPDLGTAVSSPIVPDVPDLGAAVSSPTAPDVPDLGAAAPSPIVPDVSDGNIAVSDPTAPDVPDGETAVPSPIVPDTELPDSTGSTGAEEPAGASAFLTDDAGMIYGFVPENAIIDDGVLELPKEGCNGIRSGAFAGCSAEVIELYIPANVSTIEEGAFAGLDLLEWIDAEAGNPGYVSMDGVLFDNSGTVLIAFPNGRTGAYMVPAEVTRIADGAFANTSLCKLDMRACGEIVAGNDVFGEMAGSGVELAVPNEYLEMYQSVFGKYAVSFRFL